MTQLIREQATGSSQHANLVQQLETKAGEVQVPQMPKTAAVLERIQASDDHPGAIFRLAGDRCCVVLCLASVLYPWRYCAR